MFSVFPCSFPAGGGFQEHVPRAFLAFPTEVDEFQQRWLPWGTFWVRAASDIKAGGELLNSMMKLSLKQAPDGSPLVWMIALYENHFTEASSSSWLMGHFECLFWFRFFFCPKLMANRSRYTGGTSVFMLWNELFQPLRLNQFCYHPIIPSHRGWIASCALRNGVAFRPGIVPGTTKSHRLNSCLS